MPIGPIEVIMVLDPLQMEELTQHVQEYAQKCANNATERLAVLEPFLDEFVKWYHSSPQLGYNLDNLCKAIETDQRRREITWETTC